MFGLGMGELMIIFVIALIFLGPKRLPDVATSLGKAIRSFRKATRELSDQLEIDEEVKAPLRELQSALRDDPLHLPLASKPKPVPVVPPPVPVTQANAPAAPAAAGSDTSMTTPPLAAPAADKKS